MVILPAKALAPLTIRLDVPVVLVMAGLVPLMLSEPMVKALCKSRVALVIMSKLELLPNVPVLVSTKVPPVILVEPP